MTNTINTCQLLARLPQDLKNPDLCNPAAGHYFFPNEWRPGRIFPHYANREGGIHITTGAERFFFNAITCRERTLFLNIDIDSHIKAYVDLNILLLIISSSQDDYIHLVRHWNEHEISHRIHESPLVSKEWKEYYLQHLTAYGAIFRKPKTNFIDCVASELFILYHTKEQKEAFEKLQRLSREGKLLSICHSITDLTWIDPEEIAEIDTSNIENYVPLHFRFSSLPRSAIRIIRVPGLGPDTRFASWLYTPMTAEKKEELKKLQNRVYKASKTLWNQADFIALIARTKMSAALELATSSPSRMSDCVSALPLWEHFVRTYLIGTEQLGEFLCISPYFDADRFHKIPLETINQHLINHPPSTQATHFLVNTVFSLSLILINKNNPGALQRAAPAA